MLIEVQIPQLSESVAEATLVSWHKNVGDAVARDENLIDIETDKVVLELPAPAAGILVEVLKGNGDTVVSGDLIARIDTEAQATALGTGCQSCRQTRCRQGCCAGCCGSRRRPCCAQGAGRKGYRCLCR